MADLQTYLQFSRKLACAQAPQNFRSMKTLGAQAKAFREGKRWNTAQMAKAIGTSRQNIESLEGEGNRIPKYIGSLAAVMGRSVDSLLVEAGLAPSLLIKQVTGAQVSWPFELVEQERYTLLNATERGYVQRAMLDAIKECEARRSASKGGSGKYSPSSEGMRRRGTGT